MDLYVASSRGAGGSRSVRRWSLDGTHCSVRRPHRDLHGEELDEFCLDADRMVSAVAGTSSRLPRVLGSRFNPSRAPRLPVSRSAQTDSGSYPASRRWQPASGPAGSAPTATSTTKPLRGTQIRSLDLQRSRLT